MGIRHWFLKPVLVQLERIQFTMSQLTDLLAKLQADVAAESTAVDSAVTLIQGIPALIADAVAKATDAGADPATLQAFTDLSTQIEAKSGELASAVATAGAPAPAA